MSTIVALFIAGAVLLAAEVFVPGAVLGVFAALALLAGVVLSFVEYGSQGGWMAVAAALALVGVTLWFEFKILPKTAWGRRLFLKAEITGKSQAPLAERDVVVGQAGVADTTLAPSGYVTVAGKRYEAYSRSGLIAKGEALSVVGLDNFRLIVQKNS
jgi:membrane-bound serine protease (ClpP class)